MVPKLNEALSAEKIASAKERRFLVSNMILFSKMKTLLGAPFRKFRNNPEIVESCIGVNAASDEWAKLLDVLMNTCKNRAGTFVNGEQFIDRDYKWYDIMQVLIFHIIMGIRYLLRNNEHYNKPVEWSNGVVMSANYMLLCLAYDLTVYPCQVNRDIFFAVCDIASGWFGTAELNSIGESIIHRMVYLSCLMEKPVEGLKKPVKAGKYEDYFSNIKDNMFYDKYFDTPYFRDYVALINYGDDNVENVANEILESYEPSFQQVISEKLGFPVSDAKKTGTLKYSNIKDISFLKRAWFYEDFWRSPLEEKSIHKMLAWYCPSTAKSKNKQVADNMLDAQRQYFMFGRKVFEEKTQWLKHLAKKHKLEPYLPREWPTHEELLIKRMKGVLDMGSL